MKLQSHLLLYASLWRSWVLTAPIICELTRIKNAHAEYVWTNVSVFSQSEWITLYIINNRSISSYVILEVSLKTIETKKEIWFKK